MSRIEAGIEAKFQQRWNNADVLFDEEGEPFIGPRYAPREDGIREHYWLDRVEENGESGTALMICGFTHVQPLCEKAEDRGHRVIAKVLYPESLKELQIQLF